MKSPTPRARRRTAVATTMKKQISLDERWRQYEIEKRAIEAKGLSAVEYEAELQALCKRLNL